MSGFKDLKTILIVAVLNGYFHVEFFNYPCQFKRILANYYDFSRAIISVIFLANSSADDTAPSI